jgi:osmotically-inducible protein OsmY
MMARSRASAATPPRLGPERNDGDIFGEARVALDRRLDIPATVHVHVANGVATLTGTVHLPSEQLLAAETVRRVKGVRRVVNLMTLADAINAEGFEPPDTR